MAAAGAAVLAATAGDGGEEAEDRVSPLPQPEAESPLPEPEAEPEPVKTPEVEHARQPR